jgi:phospholipid/cholesterol/gamma-HCH transport system permease protein
MAIQDPTRRGTSFPGVRKGLAEVGDLTIFGVRAVAEVRGAPRYAAEVLRQFSILVRTATLFIVALNVFMGFAQTTFAYYILKAYAAADFGGAVSGLLTPRITTPFVYGYAFAAVVGASLVAEIGALKVNEELDAYEAEAVSPMRFLVATRVLAGILYAPLAAGVALLACDVGSWLNLTHVAGSMNSATFWRFNWSLQSLPDLGFALITMTISGVLVTVIACWCGYRATGGPAGVGAAVAKSVVINLPLVQAVPALAAFLVYGTQMPLPFGG